MPSATRGGSLLAVPAQLSARMARAGPLTPQDPIPQARACAGCRGASALRFMFTIAAVGFRDNLKGTFDAPE